MAYKVNIDENTAKYLVECCGSGMQELINELRKSYRICWCRWNNNKRKHRQIVYKTNSSYNI